MGLKQEDERQLARYLLGELSEDEKAQVEERFFADDERYEDLLVAEDELIFAYLSGALTARDRSLFEARLAESPKRREKIEIVRALMEEAKTVSAPVTLTSEAAERPPAESSSWWRSALAPFALLTGRNARLQFAMAAVLTLLAAGGVWLWTETRQLRSELAAAEAREREARAAAAQGEESAHRAQQQVEASQAQTKELAEQLGQEQAAREALLNKQKADERRMAAQPGLIIPFTLESGLRDGGDEPVTLAVPRNASWVQLSPMLGSDDGLGSYRAELSTAGGTLVWSQGGLIANPLPVGNTVTRPAITVNVPAGVLHNSEYELTLKRAAGRGKFEDIGYYYFKAVRR